MGKTPKIKICGLYREEDIYAVNEYKPDFAGFIIGFPKSHRNISLEQLRTYKALLEQDIQSVGVFVNASMEELLEAAPYLDVIQLHGDESNREIENLRRRLPEKEIWKALKIRGIWDLEVAADSIADCVVLDNGYGTGDVFDWKLLEHLTHTEKSFILAGGLNLSNMEEALELFQAYGFDISSGVETEKCKDKEKIKEVIQMVREFSKGKEGEERHE